MTRDELIKMTQLNPSTPQEREFIEAIHDLLNNNVIIPIGDNRHPYADVLHEAIEGTNIQELQCNEWCDVLVQDGINSLAKYRIKPSEPVYEWQAYYIDKNTGKLVILKRDSTDDYFLDWELRDNHIRIEDTKRIRK